MKTSITKLLGIEYPIIQGGMAWVAEYHLAAAVSEAGGLGLIGAANAPAEWVREQIQKVKELTKKPFGVNIMLMSPHADEVCLLYTSDAADEEDSVDLGGRRIIKKKKKRETEGRRKSEKPNTEEQNNAAGRRR